MKKQLLFAIFLFFATISPLTGQWISAKGPEGISDYSRLFKDGNTFWAPTQGGLFFSTDDGASWQNHPDILRDDNVVNVVRKGNLLFAIARGLNSLSSNYQHHLYVSENNGVTWEQTHTPFNLDWLNLPSIGVVQGSLLMFEDGRDIYRSNDDGLTWETLTLPIDYFSNLFHDDKNIVCRSYPEGVFLSSDAGGTWQMIADSAQQFVDIFLLKDSTILGHHYPNNISRFVYSPDLGQHWLEMDSLPGNSNYERFFPGSGDTIFLKNGDTFYSVNKGKSWAYYGDEDAYLSPYLRTSDGGALRCEYSTIEKYSSQTQAWTPSVSGLFADYTADLVSNEAYVFAITSNQQIVRKQVNGSGKWEEIHVAPYINSPILALAHDTLYVAGYNVVYQKTENGTGPSITLATGFGGSSAYHLSVQGDLLVLSHSNKIFFINRFTGIVQNITNLPSPSGMHNHFLRIFGNRWVYADNDGSVFVSENQGGSWVETFDQFLPGNNWYNNLFFLNDRLYFSTRNHIAISTDHGDTWTTTTAGLPLDSDGDVSLLYDMTASGNLLFATTYWRGTYVSTDFGMTWQAYNLGLPRHRGNTITASGGKLFMGTFYTSIWERDIQVEGLNGLVYADKNNNGIRDAGEQPISNVIIQSEPNGFYSMSAGDGKFTALATPTDSIKAIPPTPYANIKPKTYSAGQTPNGNYNFGIYYTPDINDLRINLTLGQPLVPGFPRELFITCSNIGTTTLKPQVLVRIPQPLLAGQISPLPVNIAGDSISWQLTDLAPQETFTISVWVQTPTTVNNGEIFTFEGTIYPIVGDEVPADNYAALRETVVGSFDPNDKSVSPAQFFTPGQFELGERLIYTIRFQNTGNYPATFVRIIDTLQATLDPASIQMLASSHPMSWSLDRGRVLQLLFSNIQLPDSTSDEPNSHGFAKFRIRPVEGLPIGQSISNRAFIYFDYNTPVETNTVSNLFDFISKTVLSALLPLQIFPNPGSGIVQIQRPSDATGELRLMDQTGKIMLTKEVYSAVTVLDLSEFPAGIYWAVVKEKDGVRIGKIVVTQALRD
ncbi:MAG: T9SS type A sorting domain-containing protein [Saprospiraceae bacterium]